MVTLQTVEIPGYREAVRREMRVRDSAFLGGKELVCGVVVSPLSLRRLIWLEQARNGHVVPCTFDNLTEACAHAIQVLYFCSDAFRLPDSPRRTLFKAWRENYAMARFIYRVRRGRDQVAIVREVREWLEEAFQDAPAGGGGVTAAGHAAYPAYIIDRFGEAALPFTEAEVMDMPLKKLWQHWRLAGRRLHGTALTNPSDDLACNHLAEVSA